MTEEQKIMDDPIVPGESNARPGDPDQTKTRLHLSHDGLFKVAFHNRYLPEEQIIKGVVELRIVLMAFIPTYEELQ